MGARDLLEELVGAGLSVSAHGDALVIRPASLLTDGMRSALRQAKPELLALLGDKPNCDRMPRDVPFDDMDSDRARFYDRRNQLIRWGWPVPLAEAIAERLARRDSTGDERVACIECRHFAPGRHTKPGRCSNHRRAGLATAEVGKDLATMLQRCPGNPRRA